MTMINMLRGGATNGPNGDKFTQNMYPRPDYPVADMAKNDGWENRPDSFHYVERFDLSRCFNGGAVERAKAADATTTECTLEVGDRIPLLWIPNRSTVEALTLDIVSGVEGVVLGVDFTDVSGSDMVIGDGVPDATLPITGVDSKPLDSGTVIDQAYLDSFKCGDRIAMDEFCPNCNNQGLFTEVWEATPVLVGGGNQLEAGRYYSLVVEALPVDFECAGCCLVVDLGARVRVPHFGN